MSEDRPPGWHLLKAGASVRFVKEQSHSQSAANSLFSSTSTNCDGNSRQLNGVEARRFYEEEVLAITSTRRETVTKRSAEKKSPLSPGKKKNQRRTPSVAQSSKSNSMLSMPSSSELNLFLRCAAENDTEGLVRLVQKLSSGTQTIKMSPSTAMTTAPFIDVTDAYGWTALMCAAASGAVDAVKHLLVMGADMERRDASGKKTAMELAIKGQHYAVVRLLEEHKNPMLSGTRNGGESSDEPANTHQSTSIPSSSSSMVTIIDRGQLPTEGYSYGIPQSNRGYQLLKSGGWCETRGLGRHAEGRKYPVKTVLKRDLKGLGWEKAEAGARKELTAAGAISNGVSKGVGKVARVTHFGPFDVRAVQDMNQRTKPRKLKHELAKRAQKERRQDARLRRMLS